MQFPQRVQELLTETYRWLHAPPGDADYTLGWAVYRSAWAGGVLLAHKGSNRFNFAQILIMPKKALRC